MNIPTAAASTPLSHRTHDPKSRAVGEVAMGQLPPPFADSRRVSPCRTVCAALVASELPAEETMEELERSSAQIGWTPAVDSHHLAEDIEERVNEERIARGLRPLVWHEGLAPSGPSVDRADDRNGVSALT